MSATPRLYTSGVPCYHPVVTKPDQDKDSGWVDIDIDEPDDVDAPDGDYVTKSELAEMLAPFTALLGKVKAKKGEDVDTDDDPTGDIDTGKMKRGEIETLIEDRMQKAVAYLKELIEGDKSKAEKSKAKAAPVVEPEPKPAEPGKKTIQERIWGPKVSA
jgi:hypothetical protein